MERVLRIAGTQDQVVEFIVPKHLGHGVHLEDVTGFGIDPRHTVVQEMHRPIAHAVAAPVRDVPPTLLPAHGAGPQAAVRSAVDRVVEAQTVLTPQEIGRRVQAEQGRAVGDEADHRSVLEQERMVDAPMGLQGTNLEGKVHRCST